MASVRCAGAIAVATKNRAYMGMWMSRATSTAAGGSGSRAFRGYRPGTGRPARGAAGKFLAESTDWGAIVEGAGCIPPAWVLHRGEMSPEAGPDLLSGEDWLKRVFQFGQPPKEPRLNSWKWNALVQNRVEGERRGLGQIDLLPMATARGFPMFRRQHG